MAHWNHRVIRTEHKHKTANGDVWSEAWYTIHEVYYNEEGEIDCWTESGVAPSGESIEEVREVLEWMLNATKKPVLVEVKKLDKTKLVEYGGDDESK